MLGVAQGAFNATVPYLNERKQFGRKIGEFQVRNNNNLSTDQYSIIASGDCLSQYCIHGNFILLIIIAITSHV